MFTTGDVRDVEAIVHPDYLDHQGLDGEPVHGPSGFVTVVTAARRGYQGLEVIIDDLIEQGDRAAARVRWRAARPSGDPAERETLEMIRVFEGLAVEHWGGRS